MTDEFSVAIAGCITVSVLLVIAKFTFFSSLYWWICLFPIWFPLLFLGIFTVVVLVGFAIKGLIETFMYR
jgi:hypothetical protein